MSIGARARQRCALWNINLYMKQFSKFFVALLSCGFASTAMAADPILWPKLALSGLGCPGGDVKKSFDAKDPNLLRIEFNQYELRPGQIRKACSIAMPMSLEPNQKLELTQLQLSGNVKTTSGDGFEIKIDTFMDSGKEFETVAKKQLTTSGDFTHSVGPLTLSRCGSKNNFRVNTSLLAKNKISQATITQMVLHFKILSCSP
jgi:hypothetical protein